MNQFIKLFIWIVLLILPTAFLTEDPVWADGSGDEAISAGYVTVPLITRACESQNPGLILQMAVMLRRGEKRTGKSSSVCRSEDLFLFAYEIAIRKKIDSAREKIEQAAERLKDDELTQKLTDFKKSLSDKVFVKPRFSTEQGSILSFVTDAIVDQAEYDVLSRNAAGLDLLIVHLQSVNNEIPSKVREEMIAYLDEMRLEIPTENASAPNNSDGGKIVPNRNGRNTGKQDGGESVWRDGTKSGSAFKSTGSVYSRILKARFKEVKEGLYIVSVTSSSILPASLRGCTLVKAGDNSAPALSVLEMCSGPTDLVYLDRSNREYTVNVDFTPPKPKTIIRNIPVPVPVRRPQPYIPIIHYGPRPYPVPVPIPVPVPDPDPGPIPGPVPNPVPDPDPGPIPGPVPNPVPNPNPGSTDSASPDA